MSMINRQKEIILQQKWRPKVYYERLNNDYYYYYNQRDALI